MTSVFAPLVRHYEQCLATYGDTSRGVDWPNDADAARRYDVMLQLLRLPELGQVSLLDVGCGTARLYDHILRHPYRDRIAYTGLDVSPAFLEVAQAKHPTMRFIERDLSSSAVGLGQWDYAVMNGVLTERRELSQRAMWGFAASLIPAVFSVVRRGMAFNVMSKHVDWERDDLFHVSQDELGAFLAREVSRHFVIRHDYGLYEYTVYVHRESQQ